MSLTDSNGGGLSAADVAAVMGNNGYNNGGFGGDNAWWLLVLLLFAYGNNGFGNNGNNGGYPYVTSDVQRGFDQNAVMSGLNGITTAVSNGFANAEVSRCNAQANALQSMNTLAMSLQNCCCENRAGLADLKYTVATEACADRNAISNGIRDVLTATQAQTQAIIDKMCQQEIDALKTQNANLQTQINLANLAASQTAQTARILSDNAAQTQALEQYLNPAPIPAYVVQNPNCCGTFNGCGCGCNG